MILLIITIAIFIIGLMLTILGKTLKIKNMLISGICIILLLVIGVAIFLIYEMEKEQEQLENQNLGQNTMIPLPDRIVYKDTNNKYKIIDLNDDEFTKIYSEIYNRINNVIEGQTVSENEIDRMQEQGSFIEFDYNTKSKNFVFMLEEDGVGIIKRTADAGQVIKTSLENVRGLINKMNKLTKEMREYDFDKSQSYNSSTKLIQFPDDLEFVVKRDGIYQKIIQSNNENYKNVLEQLDFKVEGNIPDVDFTKQNVVITISRYPIKDIKQNIGNIKYKFSSIEPNYSVNLLIVSKIVNTNCIYYDVEESEINTQSNETTNITKSGTILSINDDSIQIGLGNYASKYIIKIKDSTFIKDYEANQEIKKDVLQVGDSVYVEGQTVQATDGIETIEANRIERCSNQKIKKEVERYLKDTYRIDGMNIEYVNTDNNKTGYIIVVANFENFIYPLKLNVDSNTETFLGMGYHLQSDYGYILHEICDITLDTKITDIDNIKGLVKTIEYIAD